MAKGPLDGVGVLVTRPADQARELCTAIEAAGGEAIRFPVIEIRPRERTAIEAEVAGLDAPDICVFVSRNAVEFGLDFAADALIAAVGPATAAAVEEAGHIVSIRPAEGYDSEHLLAEPALADVSGRTIRIVRGNGGRELLGRTLEQRGAAVHYLEVYARCQPDATEAGRLEIERRFLAGEVDIVTIMSVASLDNLVALLPESCARDLGKATLVTPAARVLKVLLDRFPKSHATLAAGPQTGDMLDAITVASQGGAGQAE